MKKITKGFWLCIFVIVSNQINAQTKLVGHTIDTKGNPVPFANVLLLNPIDSSLIQGELSDLNGFFELYAESGSRVILSTSYVGYNTNYSDIITVSLQSPLEMGNIILSEGLQLQEIEVVARKPLYEQKIDRMVVNVSNSITSSGYSALEVLEKSPGILVNRQNNTISLLGKEGVVVMINGKINYQPLESIVQMLGGMPSDNIEKIELITTPPAKYDAEGNAGYINIVLKQRSDLGLSGNISASAGYGEGETASGNLSVNYRKGKINVFGNYSYFLQGQYQEFYNYRKVLTSTDINESEILTERDPTDRNNNARLGMDYTISDKTTLGLLLAAYDNKWTMDAFNKGSTRFNGLKTDSLTLTNFERNQWKHFMINLNLEHKLSEGNTISVNIDRLFYEDQNPSTYNTNFFDSSGIFERTENTRAEKITPIDIFVGQVDYSSELNKDFSVEMGAKYAISRFTNNVVVEILNNGAWVFIDQFTNESTLNEQIISSYASLDYRLDEKNSFKLGLRYEYTDSELNTLKEGRVVDREFGQLFPTLYYSRKVNETQMLGLSYNRRITRPSFNDMAPFAIFLDPNTFFFGNAALQPAISDNIKMDYRFNSVNLSLQYTREDSTIARFQDFVDPETNQQSFRPINLSSSDIITASLSFPVYFSKHWEMQNNLIGTYIEARSFYEGNAIIIDNFNYNINSTHNFIIENGLSIELSGFYTSPSLFGRSRLGAIYGINLGAQKKFENGSSLRFNVRDAFNSIVWRGGTDLSDQGFLTDGYFDFSNQTFLISYATTFGNNKLKASRARSTGSEEERQRID